VTDDRDPDGLLADAAARIERANALLPAVDGVVAALKAEIEAAVLQRANALSLRDQREAEKRKVVVQRISDEQLAADEEKERQEAIEIMQRSDVHSDAFRFAAVDYMADAKAILTERRAAKAKARSAILVSPESAQQPAKATSVSPDAVQARWDD
jgi:hypothetical protein